MCFLLNRRKLLLSLNGKTDQKANKTALAVRIFDANNIPARSLNARQARPRLLCLQADSKTTELHWSRLQIHSKTEMS